MPVLHSACSRLGPSVPCPVGAVYGISSWWMARSQPPLNTPNRCDTVRARVGKLFDRPRFLDTYPGRLPLGQGAADAWRAAGEQAAKDPKLESLFMFVCCLWDWKGNMCIVYLENRQRADERMQMLTSFDHPLPALARRCQWTPILASLAACRMHCPRAGSSFFKLRLEPTRRFDQGFDCQTIRQIPDCFIYSNSSSTASKVISGSTDHQHLAAIT